MPLTRREALKRLGVSTLTVGAGPAWLVSLLQIACGPRRIPRTSQSPSPLTQDELQTVELLSEILIPTTDTPGAREAKVSQFIHDSLAEAEEKEIAPFVKGLALLDAAAVQRWGVAFRQLDTGRADQLVRTTDALLEQCTVGQSVQWSLSDEVMLLPRVELTKLPESSRSLVEFYLGAKCLIITGFYTSEIGFRELGLDGQMFHADYQGCRHDEHKA